MFKTNDVVIEFPEGRTPFIPQQQLMEKVVLCVRNGEHGLLESPTGTGKTLALLSSALASQKDEYTRAVASEDSGEEQEEGGDEKRARPSFRKIYYASRTHSQLAQAVAELKKLPPSLLTGPESPTGKLRMITLGSRSQYCIHPDITKVSEPAVDPNEKCSTLRGKKACEMHERGEPLGKSTQEEIMDIEDLVGRGRVMHSCPFYASRTRYVDAHLIFLPYSYIVDPAMRARMKLDLAGSIIIIDEAHNIEDVCQDVVSYKYKLSAIKSTTESIERALTDCSMEENSEGAAEELRHASRFFKIVYEWAMHCTESVGPETTSDGNQTLRQWKSRGLDMKTTGSTYTSAAASISMRAATGSGIRMGIVTKPVGTYVENFIDSMDRFANGRLAEYRVGVTGKTISDKTLNFWCLSPAVAFESIRKKAHTIILTSGTLSPMKTFASELECAFKHIVEADHVCDPSERVYTRAFRMFGNQLLDSSYRNRVSGAEFHIQYWDALANVACVTQGGIVVFFSSYSMIEMCVNRWKADGMWQKLYEIKPVFVEPSGSTKNFESLVKAYRRECKREKGAMFLAVFRGKLSEGIDLRDEAARAVLIMGIPYPNFGDIYVKLKRDYQDIKALERKTNLDGDDWYNQQAFRAMNQAVGRVIRHPTDYGIVLFMEQRMYGKRNKQSLSRWIRNHVLDGVNGNEYMDEIRLFFDRMEPPPLPLLEDGSKEEEEEKQVD